MIVFDCFLAVQEDISFKDYIPLISSTVVIALFIIDRIINYCKTKNELKRTWYYKVFLEPSIDKISEFYQKIYATFKESSELLKLKDSIPHNEYMILVAKENGKFQELKREFEAEVVTPIQFVYKKVGTCLTKSVLDTEDFYTKSIEKNNFTEEFLFEFSSVIAVHKANFIKELYKPIN